jgi:glutamyl-tRNA reductase
MSVLVVGLSHRTAPLELLERTALPAGEGSALAVELSRRSDHVLEAAALLTCNRFEVYAEVGKFHGGVADIGQALAKATGVPLDELTEHLYVHYEGAAVSHLFRVASGLDSMAVGEAQILGQVRTALREAQTAGSAGRTVGHLMQNALRVGKRAHAETAIDRAGPNLVDAGLTRAAELLGPLERARVLVIGAGAMSGLAVASVQRAGVASITICSRTQAKAARLAASVDGATRPLSELGAALAEADLVIACAGAPGYLVTAAAAAGAQAARAGKPQVYVDLALPRDVQPAVAELAGTWVYDLELLGRELAAQGLAEDLTEARALVSGEVALYLADQRAKEVAPTVVALRSMAAGVVEAELSRLQTRLGDIDPAVLGELERTVHRVVEKLLHIPTVRVKELAAVPGGDSYAEALRLLFNLGSEPADGMPGLPAELPAGVELSVQLNDPHLDEAAEDGVAERIGRPGDTVEEGVSARWSALPKDPPAARTGQITSESQRGGVA